jgi:hypothetical protein
VGVGVVAEVARDDGRVPAPGAKYANIKRAAKGSSREVLGRGKGGKKGGREVTRGGKGGRDGGRGGTEGGREREEGRGWGLRKREGGENENAEGEEG